MAHALARDGNGDNSFVHILFPFLEPISLHWSAHACTSNLAYVGASKPIMGAGAPIGQRHTKTVLIGLYSLSIHFIFVQSGQED